MARRLIIVTRDDPGLYHYIRSDWIGDETVTVMYHTPAVAGHHW